MLVSPKKVNLGQKAAKFGVLLASDPRDKNAAKRIFMAHVVSERRARKLEKQDAEAVVGSEGTFGSEEDFFTK